MTIEELLAATGLTANDLVPIYDAEAAQNVEPTQKVTATQLAAAIKVLASLVNTTEMNAAIAQSTATGGVGYFKSPDGTLIQWGIIEGAKSGDHISYAIPYDGNMPSITITPYYNSITTIRCILVANPQPSQTEFILYAYDTSTGAVSTSTTLQCRWIAAGRWK